MSQADGSIIAYRHDKPTLAESKTVYKSGIDGFWVTQDFQGSDTATAASGKWKAGFDSSGNAVLNVLSVIGINFDWAHGGTLTLGGQNNTNGKMRILDVSGKQIGSWEGSEGLVATKGKFSGALEAATGTFSGNLSAVGGTFSGNLQAAGGSFTGELKAATGTFSGNLSAVGGTFSGNLSAAGGTFTGEITSDNYSYWTKISNGRLSGGIHGSSESGYISFNTRYTATGSYGVRVAGRGLIALYAPYLGVGDYAEIGSGGTVTVGKSGSVSVETSGGSVKTITFKNGLMVTAL